jgi:hypothetical protein
MKGICSLTGISIPPQGKPDSQKGGNLQQSMEVTCCHFPYAQQDRSNTAHCLSLVCFPILYIMSRNSSYSLRNTSTTYKSYKHAKG